ncbi:MAG TPA: hypothetical protein VGC55_08770 [Dokdonella sp.]
MSRRHASAPFRPEDAEGLSADIVVQLNHAWTALESDDRVPRQRLHRERVAAHGRDAVELNPPGTSRSDAEQ